MGAPFRDPIAFTAGSAMVPLYFAHSGLRYLVLLVGFAAALYALVGVIRKQPLDRTGRIFGTAFVGLLDLQILLGLALLFFRPWYPAMMGHLFMMIAAAVVAHAGAVVNKRRPPERRSFTIQLVSVGAALLLVVLGIMAIGRGVFQTVRVV
jgi:hypothetical protein